MPIDLDEWWAQRFLANIDKLSWHSPGICGSWRTVRRWDLKRDGSQRRGSLGRRCDGSKGHDVIQMDGQRWDANMETRESLELYDPSNAKYSVCDRLRAGGWRHREVEVSLILPPSQQRCHVTLKCSKIVFSRSSVWHVFNWKNGLFLCTRHKCVYSILGFLNPFYIIIQVHC